MTLRTTLFRPQRGTLAAAMAEVREIKDRAALIAHLSATYADSPVEITDAAVCVTPYGFDKRTGWQTYLVTVEGWGPAGFTNALL